MFLGKKHHKNEYAIGKHKQPFKFPKARSSPYKKKLQPWQNSDIDDIHKIPGVPTMDFENPSCGGNFAQRSRFGNNQNFSRFHRGGGTRRGLTGGRGFNRGVTNLRLQQRECGRGFVPNQRRQPRNVSDNSVLNTHGQSNMNINQKQGQNNPADLNAISGLLNNQAILTRLEEGLAEPSNSGYVCGSRGRGTGWGQDNLTERYHPYSQF